MSYCENGFKPVIYGIGCYQRFNYEQVSKYIFTYKIPAIKGNIVFLAQPVYRNGTLGDVIVIGNFIKE